MKRLLFALLLLPAIAGAEDVNLTAVLSAIKPGTITIIGEHHQRPESARLFLKLVDEALKQNPCLVVALEIASNQQAAIDKAAARQGGIDSVLISSIIDHPPYREMLGGLAAMKQRNSCLTLAAIDAGDDVDMNRDKWMALKISAQLSKVPVLILLGNMHALQRVKWNDGIVSPSVAEILIGSGRTVKTFSQDWPEPCSSPRSGRFYAADQSAALPALHRIFSNVNAEMPISATNVVDGFIIWECGKGALRR